MIIRNSPASLLANFLLMAQPVPYSMSLIITVALYGVLEFSDKQKHKINDAKNISLQINILVSRI